MAPNYFQYPYDQGQGQRQQGPNDDFMNTVRALYARRAGAGRGIGPIQEPFRPPIGLDPVHPTPISDGPGDQPPFVGMNPHLIRNQLMGDIGHQLINRRYAPTNPSLPVQPPSDGMTPPGSPFHPQPPFHLQPQPYPQPQPPVNQVPRGGLRTQPGLQPVKPPIQPDRSREYLGFLLDRMERDRRLGM